MRYTSPERREEESRAFGMFVAVLACESAEDRTRCTARYTTVQLYVHLLRNYSTPAASVIMQGFESRKKAILGNSETTMQ